MEPIVYFPAGNGFITELAEAATRADGQFEDLRIMVGDGWVRFRVGEGPWTAAKWTGADPEQQPIRNDGYCPHPCIGVGVLHKHPEPDQISVPYEG